MDRSQLGPLSRLPQLAPDEAPERPARRRHTALAMSAAFDIELEAADLLDQCGAAAHAPSARDVCRPQRSPTRFSSDSPSGDLNSSFL